MIGRKSKMFKSLLGTILIFNASVVLAQNPDSIITQVKKNIDRVETFTADAYVYEYYGCTGGLDTSAGRYSYVKPSTVTFEVNRDSVWKPYEKLSNCASNLYIALMILPILSLIPIDTLGMVYSISGVEESMSYITSYTSNDSVYQYTLDREKSVITALLIGTTSGQTLYNGTFSWGFFNDTVPYLESVKIDGDTGFHWGGVLFYNIQVNGASRVKERNLQHNVRQPEIEIRYTGSGMSFLLPPESTTASLYDFAGKMVYRATFRQRAEKVMFLWNGHTLQGQSVAPGWYTIAGDRGGQSYARAFFFGSR